MNSFFRSSRTFSLGRFPRIPKPAARRGDHTDHVVGLEWDPGAAVVSFFGPVLAANLNVVVAPVAPATKSPRRILATRVHGGDPPVSSSNAIVQTNALAAAVLAVATGFIVERVLVDVDAVPGLVDLDRTVKRVSMRAGVLGAIAVLSCPGPPAPISGSMKLCGLPVSGWIPPTMVPQTDP